jgi:hypothetical protein
MAQSTREFTEQELEVPQGLIVVDFALELLVVN